MFSQRLQTSSNPRGDRVAEPIYRRIADDLRLRIESGVLAPGSRLPTEAALRDRYQVSRNTIRDALKWLLNRGLVEIRHGQGTFVASSLKPFITTLSPDWRPGSTGPGDPSFDEIFHPVAERLLARCDAVLRIGGPSAGADQMVAQARAQGKRVYTSSADVPAARVGG